MLLSCNELRAPRPLQFSIPSAAIYNTSVYSHTRPLRGGSSYISAACSFDKSQIGLNWIWQGHNSANFSNCELISENFLLSLVCHFFIFVKKVENNFACFPPGSSFFSAPEKSPPENIPKIHRNSKKYAKSMFFFARGATILPLFGLEGQWHKNYLKPDIVGLWRGAL